MDDNFCQFFFQSNPNILGFIYLGSIRLIWAVESREMKETFPFGFLATYLLLILISLFVSKSYLPLYLFSFIEKTTEQVFYFNK